MRTSVFDGGLYVWEPDESKKAVAFTVTPGPGGVQIIQEGYFGARCAEAVSVEAAKDWCEEENRRRQA